MIKIQYLGQCGFIIESSKVRIAVDPVLTDLVEGGVSIRNYPPVMPPEQLDVDYIFCTHDHIDHMALGTLTVVAETHEKTRFVVPAGCVNLMTEAGIPEDRVQKLGSRERIVLGEGILQVRGISAAHPVHQVDEKGLDHNLVYDILMGNTRLVHLGDTCLTEQLEAELKASGSIQVLFPPINGMDEEKAARGIIGNLSCEEAAYLAVVTGAELSIPTHFDMVTGNTENPEKFVHALKARKEDAGYWIPDLERNCITISENK